MGLKDFLGGNRKRHFFLSTAGEYQPLAEPHACWELDRMRDSLRDDYMLVRIEPPFRDERIGPEDLDTLILSTRLRPHSLYPITSWPVHVYVTRVVEPAILKALRFKKEEVQLLAWGAIFETLKDAEEVAKRFRRAS